MSFGFKKHGGMYAFTSQIIGIGKSIQTITLSKPNNTFYKSMCNIVIVSRGTSIKRKNTNKLLNNLTSSKLGSIKAKSNELELKRFTNVWESIKTKQYANLDRDPIARQPVEP